MIKLLIKKTIKNYEDVSDNKVREGYSVLAGVLGILCNVFLFALKLIIGWSVNSIAIISDSFNNLSDTGSSAVTVIGAKMSNKSADREHPYGHGRIEYVSSLIVSFIIMLVGFEVLKSSADKILHPTLVFISPVMLVILILSVLVKVWMFSYNRYMGSTIGSGVLKAAASDSLNDVFATSAVIVSSFIGQYFPSVPVDGIIGVLVSLLIIKAGFEIAAQTVSTLLGSAPDAELVSKLQAEILSAEGIVGVHDLLVHDYGPGRVIASVHAEVPDDVDIVKVHEVIDEVEKQVRLDMGIELVIHMDPISVNCERTAVTRSLIAKFAAELNPSFTIHDFRMTDGEQNINLIFDLVVPCELSKEQREAAVDELNEKLKQADSRYNTVICVDADYTGR